MTQPAFNQEREDKDLEHYGVVGMKWGKSGSGRPSVSVGRTAGSLAREARNTKIKGARENLKGQANELGVLKQKRLTESSAKGKAKLDSLIGDKEFALKNSNDAALASQRTTGEKWLKGAKVATLVATSLVVGNTVATLIDQEVFKPEPLAGKSGPEINAMLREAGEIDNQTYADRVLASRRS